MSDKIYLRRGNIADIPALAAGEPGFATDTGELFVGSASGNVQIKYRHSGFLALKATAGQSILAATDTKVTFEAETYDYLSEYDTVTSLFTAKQAGDFLVNTGIYVTNPTDQVVINISIFKNGAVYLYFSALPGSGTAATVKNGSLQIPLAIGDTLGVYVNSGSAFTIGPNGLLCYFQCYKLN